MQIAIVEKKRRKSFCKTEVKWEKKSSWTKEGKTVTMYKDELDLYRTQKKPFRNLKINFSSSSPWIKRTGLNYQTDWISPPWISLKFSNTRRFVYTLRYNWHWKTLSSLWRPRKQHWKSRPKHRFYEKTQHFIL